ncbi:MAG: hypothetical protein V1649_00875 [Patescibacteria group bacterium]
MNRESPQATSDQSMIDNLIASNPELKAVADKYAGEGYNNPPTEILRIIKEQKK